MVSRLGQSEGWDHLDRICEDFCVSFGDETITYIIEEFNKLKQGRLVIEYQVRFEELRSLMMNAHPALIEHYFVSSFIYELNDELWPIVKMI